MTDRMTPAEAVMLCRFAKACCPQQQFDEYTPDAWFELLRDLRFADCKDAIIEVTKGQPFVSPSEIRRKIVIVRINRLDAFGPYNPPRELADTPGTETVWRRTMERRICDGDLTRDEWDAEQAAAGVTGTRELPELEGVFRRIPDDV